MARNSAGAGFIPPFPVCDFVGRGGQEGSPGSLKGTPKHAAHAEPPRSTPIPIPLPAAVGEPRRCLAGALALFNSSHSRAQKPARLLITGCLAVVTPSA